MKKITNELKNIIIYMSRCEQKNTECDLYRNIKTTGTILDAKKETFKN